MRRIISITLTLAVFAGLAWAQATAPQPQTTEAPPASQTAPPAGGPHGHHAQQGAPMPDMMQQHLTQAQARVDQMKAALAKVKSNDPALKQFLQADLDMWQTMVEHMKQMSAHMQGGMSMMGHEGMDKKSGACPCMQGGGGMGCVGGCDCGHMKPGASDKDKTPPPPTTNEPPK